MCKTALDSIAGSDSEVIARARWRQTPAFPAGSGPDFVNGAALVRTTLSASDFLKRLHAIEAALGRVRRERWGPRVCDLDLLAFGDSIMPDRETVSRLMELGASAQHAPLPDQMILPHPRMHERAFVLAPLADIAADWRHPLTDRTVADMLAALPDEARAEIVLLEGQPDE